MLIVPMSVLNEDCNVGTTLTNDSIKYYWFIMFNHRTCRMVAISRTCVTRFIRCINYPTINSPENNAVKLMAMLIVPMSVLNEDCNVGTTLTIKYYWFIMFNHRTCRMVAISRTCVTRFIRCINYHETTK
jgi:hypothetical protein